MGGRSPKDGGREGSGGLPEQVRESVAWAGIGRVDMAKMARVPGMCRREDGPGFISDWMLGRRKGRRHTHVLVFGSGGSRVATAKGGNGDMGECDELPAEFS